jgi:hypothetical protein
MFRATSAHHQEDQIFFNTSYGIIHATGTQDSHPLECIIPDYVLTQFDPPDDEHLLLETCRGAK